MERILSVLHLDPVVAPSAVTDTTTNMVTAATSSVGIVLAALAAIIAGLIGFNFATGRAKRHIK